MSGETMTRNRILLASVLLTFTALFWGGNTIVGRLAAFHDVPPLSLSFWRWALAFVILAPFGLPRALRQREHYRGRTGQLFVLALLSVTAYNTCQYVALNHTTAVNVGVVSSIIPVVIFALTRIMGQERATPHQIVGLAAATVGVLAVLGRGDPRVLLHLALNVGDLVMLVGAVCWAFYSVFLRRLPPVFDPIGLMSVFMGLGIAGIAPFYAWDVAAGRFPALDRDFLLIVGYAGLFASVIAYLSWNTAVSLAGANRAGLFMNMAPLLSSLMAVILLGEPFEWFHLLSMGLIFSGIYLATRRQQPA